MDQINFKFCSESDFLDFMLEQFGHDAYEYCKSLIEEANDKEGLEEEIESLNMKIDEASSCISPLNDILDEIYELSQTKDIKELEKLVNKAYSNLSDLEIELM
jgi:archaellum component FlaC